VLCCVVRLGMYTYVRMYVCMYVWAYKGRIHKVYVCIYISMYNIERYVCIYIGMYVYI